MWPKAAARNPSDGIFEEVQDDDDFDAAREAMVATIAAEVRETRQWLGKEALSPRVTAAMAAVPRHLFVPPEHRAAAYVNRPLPIGHAQTISQPYIVAIMTELAEAGPGRKVLEVGTGCGYQAAVLAETGAEVFSVELVPELARAATERLAALGYGRVRVRQGDGAAGWPEAAPFDAVLVTAAASGQVPQALIDQLAPGGRMVVPVERPPGRFSFLGLTQGQELMLLTKSAEGEVEERAVLPVAFVPLVPGQHR